VKEYNAFMRWLNRHFRKRITCGYCNKSLLITWKWRPFRKGLKCDCPGMQETMRIRRNKRAKEEQKKIRKGDVLTTTANYCLVCGKELKRKPGQIMFYCCPECRRKRHNRRRGRGQSGAKLFSQKMLEMQAREEDK